MRLFIDFIYNKTLINNETTIIKFDFVLRKLNYSRLL